MALASLVSLFNQKFAQEQGNPHYRPLIIEQGRVSAVSEQKRIDITTFPVHYTGNRQLTAGVIAASHTTPFDSAINVEAAAPGLVNHSIPHFDRLSRTTQLLNALELMDNRSNFFVLEISPRHIFALDSGHGAYFKEIVSLCGLQTTNIVCCLTLYGAYNAHHEQLLLAGLNNYRALGYKIAVNVGYLLSSNHLEGFIQRLAPDYLLINAPTYGYTASELRSHLLAELQSLKQIAANPYPKMIMREIQDDEQMLFAQEAKVDLIAN
jgi:hypothetical protein